jgi:hypothetical protein
LYVFSRDTTFLIGGISKFEVSKLKNSVKGQMNSYLSRANADFRDVFQAKPITKPYVSLCKCCRGFGIQMFLRTIQNFQENHGQTGVDQWLSRPKRALALWGAGVRRARAPPREEHRF